MPRPKTPLVTRQGVVEVAIGLLDEHGLDAVTTRRIGVALGVTGTSLYHHFRDKDAVLEAIVNELLGRVEVPDESLPPAEWFLRLAEGHRAVFAEHPNAAYLIGKFSAEARTRATDASFRQLSRDGVTRDHGAAFSALLQYVVGSIVLPAPKFAAGDREIFRLAFSSLYRGLVENLSTETARPVS